MKTLHIVFLCLPLLFTPLGASAQPGQNRQGHDPAPPYKDPRLPVEVRVSDLLSRMTLEEKLWQLFMVSGDLAEGKEKYRNGIFGLQLAAVGGSGGVSEQMLHYGPSGTARSVAEKINATQRFFVEETRLGIPIIPFDEALHGLVREGATAFPQSIALAATWNPVLMSEVARAIASETRTRGIRQILSPVVNVATDVRWGRVEETYGEDPFLSAVMGTAFVREFEIRGVITTPKHFVANHGDGGRDSYPAHWSERWLEEIYFPPFKACFQSGGSHSVMTAYNALDGQPCSANEWLLKRKLRQEWGFTGFVISDAGSVGGINDLHRTTAGYAESAKRAIEGGLDVLLQTSVDHFPLFFRPALADQPIDPRAVDEAVARVLRVKFELGLFENPYVDPGEAATWNGHASHRERARQAAREAVVLLKNRDAVLPLPKGIASIAVIGPDAAEARLGGYSGPGIRTVSILEGVKAIAGRVTRVIHVKGTTRDAPEVTLVPAQYLRSSLHGIPEHGLLGEYWDNPVFSGPPAIRRIDKEMQFTWTLFSPGPAIPSDWFSVRWTGELLAPITGRLKIGLEGNDGYRLSVNDSLIIDNWEKRSSGMMLQDCEVVQGRRYPLKIEYREPVGNARLRLVWDYGVDTNWRTAIDEAVRAARASDVAVIAAGLIEGESLDRAFLGLPGHQEDLIRSVAATGKPVVVVLVGGSAVTMNRWIDNVHAVLHVWYPGEEGGNAVADVLFGDYNPGGRLPITFPLAEGQVPLSYYHKPTGRLDHYYDLPGDPLFPFGYGLSYTRFEYANLIVENPVLRSGDSVRVRFTVRNTGTRAGDEVVQVYIKDLLASVTRPIMELKGFQRVHLGVGEVRELSFVIAPEAFAMLEKDLKKVIEPGEFRILVGGSSKDIRLRGTVTVN